MTEPDTAPPRLLPPVALLLALIAEAAMIGLNWPVAPGLFALGIGALFIACGLALATAAAGLFRRSKTGVRPFTQATTVVSTGPYRFTRNPMYLGMTLVLIGAALASGVVWSLIVPAIFALWIHFTYIRREERFMEAAMGQDYLDYKASTPRWLGPI